MWLSLYTKNPAAEIQPPTAQDWGLGSSIPLKTNVHQKKKELLEEAYSKTASQLIFETSSSDSIDKKVQDILTHLDVLQRLFDSLKRDFQANPLAMSEASQKDLSRRIEEIFQHILAQSELLFSTDKEAAPKINENQKHLQMESSTLEPPRKRPRVEKLQNNHQLQPEENTFSESLQKQKAECSQEKSDTEMFIMKRQTQCKVPPDPALTGDADLSQKLADPPSVPKNKTQSERTDFVCEKIKNLFLRLEAPISRYEIRRRCALLGQENNHLTRSIERLSRRGWIVYDHVNKTWSRTDKFLADNSQAKNPVNSMPQSFVSELYTDLFREPFKDATPPISPLSVLPSPFPPYPESGVPQDPVIGGPQASLAQMGTQAHFPVTPLPFMDLKSPALPSSKGKRDTAATGADNLKPVPAPFLALLETEQQTKNSVGASTEPPRLIVDAEEWKQGKGLDSWGPEGEGEDSLIESDEVLFISYPIDSDDFSLHLNSLQ